MPHSQLVYYYLRNRNHALFVIPRKRQTRAPVLPGVRGRRRPGCGFEERIGAFTPPKATCTGLGFNRGSGGGARGCGFKERIGAYARTEGGHFL